MNTMSMEARLRVSLAVMRLSVGVFFLVWSLEKILAPEIAQRVFASFYFIPELPASAAIAIGAGQTLIVLGFLIGAFKVGTYGALLAIHTVSVLSTWDRLIDPYEPPNHLFWAGVPVLAALVALFLLRRADTRLTIAAFASSRASRNSHDDDVPAA